MASDSAWTWGSVIDAAGGTKRVSEGLIESTSTVSGWRTRPGGIPGRHWASIVKLAREADNDTITLEVLAELAARRPTIKLEEART